MPKQGLNFPNSDAFRPTLVDFTILFVTCLMFTQNANEIEPKKKKFLKKEKKEKKIENRVH